MKRVLLVEPDAALGDTIATYLGRSGYVTELVSSSQSAIHAADEVTPDAVVLELAIPEHNGVEFLQEFRSYADWLNVPIIVYSRIALEDTMLTDVEWQKYGVNNYLYKPTVTLAALTSALDELV